ncbi:MAG TPA: flagellar biosynthetic protein FliO [Spirochaetia bacterium]|nr:flagellar biosynthetic protein FliO [Spirochaetia bacterium]
MFLALGAPSWAQAKATAASGGSPAAPASPAASAKPGSSQQINESDLTLPDSGAPAAGGAAAPASSGGVSTWDFVRMLLILAAVVGVIYLLFWLLRRGAGRRIQENSLIRVLGSRNLAGNRSLHLVEVGKSVFLVGAADGGVDLISEIKDQESLDAVHLSAAEERPSARRTFQQTLGEIFRPAKSSISLTESVGLLRRQRDRLRKL